MQAVNQITTSMLPCKQFIILPKLKTGFLGMKAITTLTTPTTATDQFTYLSSCVFLLPF